MVSISRDEPCFTEERRALAPEPEDPRESREGGAMDEDSEARRADVELGAVCSIMACKIYSLRIWLEEFEGSTSCVFFCWYFRQPFEGERGLSAGHAGIKPPAVIRRYIIKNQEKTPHPFTGKKGKSKKNLHRCGEARKGKVGGVVGGESGASRKQETQSCVNCIHVVAGNQK